jgi:hypothetical protein
LTQSKWVSVLEKAFYNCELLKTFETRSIIQTGIRDGFISMGHGRHH